MRPSSFWSASASRPLFMYSSFVKLNVAWQWKHSAPFFTPDGSNSVKNKARPRSSLSVKVAAPRLNWSNFELLEIIVNSNCSMALPMRSSVTVASPKARMNWSVYFFSAESLATTFASVSFISSGSWMGLSAWSRTSGARPSQNIPFLCHARFITGIACRLPFIFSTPTENWRLSEKASGWRWQSAQACEPSFESNFS